MKKQYIILLFATAFIFVGCSSRDLKKELAANPDVLFKVIEENPEKFMQAVQVAATKTRELSAKTRIEREEKALELALENPLHPKITKDDAVLGPKDSPLVLVEYSDFECPYCSRGSEVVKSLLEKYKGKIKLVYKHLPLSFHPNAMIAAKYFEGIKRQSTSKAFKFHDMIFAEQRRLKQGEAFLKEVAGRLNLNMSKLLKDVKSKEVESQIATHLEETREFKMQGTPGFILNGVPVRGAYPVEHFVSIIEKLQERGKVKI